MQHGIGTTFLSISVSVELLELFRSFVHCAWQGSILMPSRWTVEKREKKKKLLLLLTFGLRQLLPLLLQDRKNMHVLCNSCRIYLVTNLRSLLGLQPSEYFSSLESFTLFASLLLLSLIFT
jgi:hypothetical protein